MMSEREKQFIVDAKGDRVGVLLGMEDYRELVDNAEELEAIRSFDVAKAAGDEALPLEEALQEIDRTRS